MMKSACVILFLVAGASALTYDASDKAWGVNPITKVVNMLKEMNSELQAEADNEEALYEKMGCYCETNRKEKTTAISNAEQAVKDLTSLIEENNAKSAILTTEVETLTKEIANNNAALGEATSMRGQQKDEFV